MEHVHEPSDDSYCTTDEGGDERIEEEPGPIPITEKINEEIVIKPEGIFKTIYKIGTSGYKPFENDNVVLTCQCFYYDVRDIEKKNKIYIDFCIFNGDKEISLKHYLIPKSLNMGICSMRIDEESEIKIKFKYIYKFIDIETKKINSNNNNNNSSEDNNNKCYNLKTLPSFFTDQNFFNSNKNTFYLYFHVTLNNFYMIQNLYDNELIQKKILKISPERKLIYAKNSDIITYDIQCLYDNKILYQHEKITTELDKDFDNGKIFEIERRILENIKVNEKSQITVKAEYMKEKNKNFLEKFGIENNNNTKDIIFIIEVYNIDKYDYVFNINKDKYSKSKIIKEGFGLESPDREMFVKLKLMIKINNEIKFNTFEYDNINDYLNNDKKNYIEELNQWRDNINKENNIANINDTIDINVSKKIFESLKFPNLLSIDMKNYTLPILFRKVLVHMKRNEIRYIKSTYIDYFNINDVELYNIGTFGKDTNVNIEVYIHLYEFQNLPLFGSYSYEDKLQMLLEYKNKADECFKQNKIYRAMKIYHNLNYRFDEGDIYGHNKEEAIKLLKEKNNELYNKLNSININVHNNYALCKFKLGKIFSCYEASSKVLKDFDDKNEKALYLFAKSTLMLKFYDKAHEAVKVLIQLKPDDRNIKEIYNEVEKQYNNDKSKERNMFRKMFKYKEFKEDEKQNNNDNNKKNNNNDNNNKEEKKEENNNKKENVKTEDKNVGTDE